MFHGEETVRDLSILACMQELQRFLIGYEDTANIEKEIILTKIMLHLFSLFMFYLLKIIFIYFGYVLINVNVVFGGWEKYDT